MGEAGAEAIMPLTRTSTGDLGIQVDFGRRRGGGDVYFQMGAPIIHVEYTAPEGATPETDGQKIAESIGAQLRKELVGFVRQELIMQSRPGGLLNPGIGA
jgi:phage-related minor tail protein